MVIILLWKAETTVKFPMQLKWKKNAYWRLISKEKSMEVWQVYWEIGFIHPPLLFHSRKRLNFLNNIFLYLQLGVGLKYVSSSEYWSSNAYYCWLSNERCSFSSHIADNSYRECAYLIMVNSQFLRLFRKKRSFSSKQSGYSAPDFLHICYRGNNEKKHCEHLAGRFITCTSSVTK